MLPISTRNATLASLMIALGLTMSACSKHESAESKPTEEIAAQQGEIARANHPMPVASQPASFVPPTAASAAATTTTATATQVSADAGEKLFGSVCTTCHTAGLMGAPKFGDKAAWAPRIAQGKDTLYKHAISGYQGKAGVMPAKGGSQASDDEVKAAVDYMVSKAS
ncbi:cytochrome c5 family protein [Moraxella osloensis]|uniref:Cytochrome c5 family protein n=1 Tax=Faucicola osloensis TaxID=34062 RepID=A0AAW6TCI3_FAUOS|nr:c-type cytochrome [Moraxella osloensis]MDI4509348.1 cytochrome c5 family protein [Moraxella osloensis]